MAKAYTFTARIEDGRLKVGLQALRVMREVLKGWRACPVTVTVERQHATRSLEANAYYWSVVVHHISEHTGYTPEETHEALKTLFLPKRLALLGQNGDLHGELVIAGTTTSLNKVEFYEYVEQVRVFAREKLGVETPDPDPGWRESLETEAA
jgi:hypothetical protein